MAHRTLTHDHETVRESKFYLPAAVPSVAVTSRLEAVWARLFNHRI